MGMIYKRGKVYWIKYYRNGKPYYESSKTKKDSDARKLLKKREGEISDGKLPGVYFDRVKFDELAENFLRDYGINDKKSLVRAERSVGHLKKHFEGVSVTGITTPRIETYIENRMEWTCNECGERFAAADECPFCGSADLLPTFLSINTDQRSLVKSREGRPLASGSERRGRLWP